MFKSLSIIAFLTCWTGSVSAQSNVTIIVRESFSSENIAAVVERGGERGASTVLAIRRSELRVDLINAAFETIAASQLRHGEHPATRVRVIFRTTDAVAVVTSSRSRALEALVDRLRAAADFERVTASVSLTSEP